VWLRRHYTSAPVCAPARASLMLGRDQGHCAIRDNMFDEPIPDAHTLGSVLQKAGYHTCVIGKWGIGGKKAPWEAHPMKRGFDEFFGIMKQIVAHNHYPGNNNGVFDGFEVVTDGLDNAYSTDLFIARSKKYIQEQAASDQPFFLYLALTAPHARLQVPCMPYPRGAGLNGGLQWPLNTRGGTKDSFIHPDYADTTWPESAKRHATMIRRIDDGLGDLVQTLKDLGIDEDTLLVFSSDNGPHDEAGKNGHGLSQDPAFFDSWGPLEGIKRDLFEGGIRVPTFVRWPAELPSGKIIDDPSAFWDWMPTFAEIAGVPVPDRSNGESLLSVLKRGAALPERALYFEYYHPKKFGKATARIFESKGVRARNQMRALVDGSYKIVAYDVVEGSPDYRLYNVDQDPHEDQNLAGEDGGRERYSTLVQEITRRRVSYEKAVRPYDDEEMMPEPVEAVRHGIEFAVSKGPYPWIPKLEAETVETTRIVSSLSEVNWRNIKQGDAVMIKAWLKVEKDGMYRISTAKSWTANVWLGRAQVVDGEAGLADHDAVSHWVPLRAGYHALCIRAVAPNKTRRLTLFLDDKGGEKKAMDEQILYVDQTLP